MTLLIGEYKFQDMRWVAEEPRLSAGQLLHEYYSVLRSRFGPQKWWPARTRLEVILGAILTQNAAWHNATLGLRNLRKGSLLNWRGLRRASLSEVEACVRPSGFYRQKARTIRDFVDWVCRRHGGSLGRLFSLPVVELRRQLLDLRGLGPETVDAIILYAAQRPVFVADAYTRRVLARHGFLSHAASYYQAQEFLHEHLPLNAPLFNEFHALLVEVGKKHCKRRMPSCACCPLERFLPSGGTAASATRGEEPAATGSSQELQAA